MVRYHLVAAALAATVSSVPLNINLGAYSPALVVGDGEISFGGNQDVAGLMNALEGAAVSAASGSKVAEVAEAAAVTPAAAAPAPVIASQAASRAGATEDQQAAKGAPPAASVPTLDPALQETASQISTLQGMGKEIAPREGTAPEAPKDKRDLAGFDRALKFAEAALTKGPVIQMGTGEGGSGVGLTVDNRPAGAQAAAAQAPAVAKAKRQEPGSAQPRRRTKVTTMFIRRGLPAGLQKSAEISAEIDAREVPTVPVAVPALKLKRDDEGGEEKRATTNVDAINLNVADPQGITMTFVETADEGDDE